MELPPPHVLAQLDALIVGQSIAAPSVEVEDDDDRSISSAAFGIESSATSFSEPVEDESGGAPTASSRFWGVYWDRRRKKWHAYYYDADDKKRSRDLARRRCRHLNSDNLAARGRDRCPR